jgi:beta-lactamase regulating signal transducer with metallopeptidase domain
MIWLPDTHWFAAQALERMLYCVAEGTALAICTSLILRFAPRVNSHTRFVVRLSTLVAIALLPLFGAGWRPETVSSVSPHSVVTIPVSWAAYIMMGWVVLASIGLLRVATGLWQIRGLRRNSYPIDPQVLAPETQTLIQEFRKSRSVSVLVSSQLGVPTAIGFIRPAVILPAWLAEPALPEGATTAELHHAILHELAHLRRRDDWTNLAQKIVKAVLFFHPGVWWVERKLSLDREMACDDAVLAQTLNARAYAQSLAHVAEKSFLRRKFALAQAAVDRMRQLSFRVAQILNEGHPRTTKLWKPALPLVTVLAAVCAVATSGMPKLIGVADQPPTVAASMPGPTSSSAPAQESAKSMHGAGAAVVQANWQPSQRVSVIPARYSPARPVDRKLKRLQKRAAIRPRTQPNDPALLAASYSPGQTLPENEQPGFLVMVVETRFISSPHYSPAGNQILQINTWEVRWYVPERPPTKQIPRKT